MPTLDTNFPWFMECFHGRDLALFSTLPTCARKSEFQHGESLSFVCVIGSVQCLHKRLASKYNICIIALLIGSRCHKDKLLWIKLASRWCYCLHTYIHTYMCLINTKYWACVHCNLIFFPKCTVSFNFSVYEHIYYAYDACDK